MKVDEVKDEEMYALTAPDGSIQLMTLAPDYAMCIAMAEMLSRKGICQSISELFKKGFEVMPVKVNIIQNGDSESAFQKVKRKYNKLNK